MLDPDVVYRQFYDRDNHLDMKDDMNGVIKTLLFKGPKMSVWDGALFTSDQVANKRNPPCGVVAVPKSAIAAAGKTLRPDQPGDEDYQEGHMVVMEKLNNPVGLMNASTIVRPMPGLRVTLRRPPEDLPPEP